MTTLLDLGNNTGWMIDDDSEISEQEQKKKALFLATENILRTLEKVVKIYSEFANPAMFEAFENAVFKAMEKGKYENYFNDKNYEENSDQKD